MNDTDIRNIVLALDTRDVVEEEQAWQQLKALGPIVLSYFLDSYSRMKKWQGRASLVFHAIRFARTHKEAFDLGIKALRDKATLVRYRACGLLAYSLRQDAIPHLQELLNHENKKTREDAKAAISAIRHQNHHYFVDRDHSGRVFWEVNEGDVKLL